jgi:hypothetical protein
MSRSLLVLATIWNYQIVRFWDRIVGNNLVIPERSRKAEITVNGCKSAGIANGAISDHIAEVSKMVGQSHGILGGMSFALF